MIVIVNVILLFQPVKSQVKLLSDTDVPASGGVIKQVVRLSALQKLLVCNFPAPLCFDLVTQLFFASVLSQIFSKLTNQKMVSVLWLHRQDLKAVQ